MCISDSSYSLHILFIFSSYSLHLSCCGLSQIVSLHLRKARTVKLHEVNFESALLEKNYEKRHIASMLEELHLVQRVATSGLKSRVESPLLNGIQEEGSYHDWVLRNEMDSVTTVLRQCYDSVTTASNGWNISARPTCPTRPSSPSQSCTGRSGWCLAKALRPSSLPPFPP